MLLQSPVVVSVAAFLIRAIYQDVKDRFFCSTFTLVVIPKMVELGMGREPGVAGP